MSETDEKFPAKDYANVKAQWLGIDCMVLPTLERVVGSHIPGKRVLDVGCGSGPYVENFLKWGAEYIVGIDQNQHMIDLCKAKFGGHTKLEFHAKSSLNLDYNDEFDVTTAIFVLQFMENFSQLEQTLASIAKALKPGGELIAFVPNGDPTIQFLEESGKKFGAYFNPISHPPPDGSEVKIIFYDNQESVIGDANAVFFYLETYEKFLKKAGFSKIEWIEPHIDQKYIGKYAEDYFDCLIKPPRDLILYAVKE